MTEENCLQVDLERVIRDKNPSLARWLPRPLLSYLKRTIHQDEINRILKSYSHLDPIGFIRATLADMRIGYRSQGLDRLPADGRYLFVSNASGGINTSFRTGDLMVITDHINLMPNPLIGPNLAELGPRFPDMHNCYDRELIAAATRIAEEEGIKLQYGVYVGGTGPTFETQAEYRYFKAIGGDAAGMSTVPEVIVARHMSIPVFGVSVITNCGLSDEVGDHEDVQRQGRKAGAKMQTLFIRMIENLK